MWNFHADDFFDSVRLLFRAAYDAGFMDLDATTVEEMQRKYMHGQSIVPRPKALIFCIHFQSNDGCIGHGR
jgi:hypothetical protein